MDLGYTHTSGKILNQPDIDSGEDSINSKTFFMTYRILICSKIKSSHI